MVVVTCQAEGCGLEFPSEPQRQDHCQENRADLNHAAAYWYCPLENCRFSRRAQEDDGNRSRKDTMLSHLNTQQHSIECPGASKKDRQLPMSIRTLLLESAVATTDAAQARKAGNVNTLQQKTEEAQILLNEAKQMIEARTAAMMEQQNAMPMQQQQQGAMSTDGQTNRSDLRRFLITSFTAPIEYITHGRTPTHMVAPFPPVGGEEVAGVPSTVWWFNSDSTGEVQVSTIDLPGKEHWRGFWLTNHEFQQLANMPHFLGRVALVNSFWVERYEEVRPLLPFGL